MSNRLSYFFPVPKLINKINNESEIEPHIISHLNIKNAAILTAGTGMILGGMSLIVIGIYDLYNRIYPAPTFEVHPGTNLITVCNFNVKDNFNNAISACEKIAMDRVWIIDDQICREAEMPEMPKVPLGVPGKDFVEYIIRDSYHHSAHEFRTCVRFYNDSVACKTDTYNAQGHVTNGPTHVSSGKYMKWPLSDYIRGFKFGITDK